MCEPLKAAQAAAARACLYITAHDVSVTENRLYLTIQREVHDDLACGLCFDLDCEASGDFMDRCMQGVAKSFDRHGRA